MAKKAQETQADHPANPQAQEPRRPEAPRTAEASLLLLMGFGITLAGLVLSMGPKFSWKVDQISQGFAYLGVHGGTLIVGGLMLAGMGMIRRGMAISLANDARDVDYELSMNQIAVDMGDVRTTLLDFDERFRGMKAAMKMITAQIAESGKQAESDGKSDDAIFRMAASIDQTWARMDKRMTELVEGLTRNLDGVHAELDQTRSALQAVAQDVQGASQRMEDLVRSAPAVAPPAAAAPQPAPQPAPQQQAQPQPEPQPEPPAPAPQPEASLGLLDDMDDYDAPMPVDSHSQQEAVDDGEPVEIHLDEPPTQAAAGQPGPQGALPVNPGLSDQAVDEALRSMRRHAEG